MKKALIIEDYKPLSDIWILCLETLGYSIIEVVENSNFVENIVIELQPDIILMDINLPGKMNGIEMTNYLMNKYPSLKILILTLNNNIQFFKKAMEAGAKGYLVKDSSIFEFNNAINAIENEQMYICRYLKISI